MAERKEVVSTQAKVTIEALVELRAEDGKKVLVGKTTKVLKTTADILVTKKKAKIVSEA